jgi:hypothetical protein
MPKPNASIVLSSRDATGGVAQNGNLYNALLFNAQNQNILQGQIQSVAVSEVNFPYDIPNIQAGTNLFALANNGGVIPGSVVLNIILTAGFYTGTELATAINVAVGIAATAATIAVADLPVFSFNAVSNLFTITPPAAPVSGPQNWMMISPYTFYSIPTLGTVQYNKLGKDIFSLMGYLQSQGVVATSGGNPNVRNTMYVSNPGAANIPPGQPSGPRAGTQSAPLTYTQYIDICSPQLCKFQFFRDGSTTNLARRSDVICRLYIANNVATQEEEGTRPFVISRQYKNARVMRWTADNAVGTIDINLYDDVGQPLTTTWAPRPFQITLNCYESPKEDMGM